MIYVCDAIMGAGKSSAAMWHMNHADGRFVYLTPYLSEVERVIKTCADRDFKQPAGNDDGFGGKTRDFYKLLYDGENIASTHAMFGRVDPETVRAVKDFNYDLILDEVYDVLQGTSIYGRDIDIAILAGLVTVDENGLLQWTDDEYSGKAFTWLREETHKMKIIRTNDGSGITVLFPPEIFDAFRDVYILTYMFDSSLMRCYFDMCGIKYERAWPKWVDDHYELSLEPQPNPEYTKDLINRVHIVEDEKLNEVGNKRTALSATWYEQSGVNGDRLHRLRKNLRTVQRRCGSGNYKNFMWCCFKDYKDMIRDCGTKHGFVPVGTRATNAYADKTDIAYLVNVFVNPFLKNAIKSNGAEVDEDGYALSELIQWVWRSAIRNGKDITLYIPSSRMRGLLKGWLADLANQ